MSSILFTFLVLILQKSLVNGGVKEIVGPTGTTYEPDFTDNVQMNNILKMAYDFLNTKTNALYLSLERFIVIHNMLKAIGLYFPSPEGKYVHIKQEFTNLSRKFKPVIKIWRQKNKSKTEADSTVDSKNLGVEIQSVQDEITQSTLRIQETYKASELRYVYNYGSIYPFSAAIWQMFHIMAFTLYQRNPDDGDGAFVLKVVKGYALHIQGCITCREDYAKITEGYDSKKYNAKESCKLLWKFHNRVTDGMDAYKKIEVSQLPTVQNIPIYFPIQKMLPSECGLEPGKIPNEDAIFNWLYQMYTNIHS